jgi:hypothetical protein
MPIEIKELHIRVTVSGSHAEPGKGTQNAGQKGEGAGGGAHGAGKDEIVAECVEEVLRVLQARRER